ncbi:alpha/beta hydrolase [Sphingosinicella sp. BN140058]|uniref:alpha/beta hydrolase n=1 Tax=Sphingosinicella sp. BN140058 TaxID=1892855 RepID=UPI001010E376|nr:alpha/beta hydrolase [Sphingosinicella sp. BN140058]QAY75733.1 alpha/beta hydrolase [Sphingosinicella sp. BN140058]
MRLSFPFVLLLAFASAALGQSPAVPVTIPLWTDGAPGSETRRSEPEQAQDYWIKNVHNPSVTVFAADPRHANGASVVVVPGGGHRIIVWTSEGLAVAQALNRMGITVFVLKYRLAREEGSRYSIEGDALGDLRRAVRWVRANAKRYDLDTDRVGVMGFSAGGELVSMLADNKPAAGLPSPRDAVDRESARPDFQIQVFPGPLGVPANAVAGAPPAFITAGSLDQCCAEPAVTLYEQLRKASVPAELHMYANADHAFNLGEASNLLSILHWPERLHDWLLDSGFLDDRSRR